jgi:histidyl-tRNA synthetase
MSGLSSQPYKGTRDYYPEDKLVQNYIFDTWKRVVRRFGYVEYGAPLLEPIEVYEIKSGQELANEQTYSFTDRGDRTVAIRPEMTPSISRMIAARRQEMAYPARLFSVANFMRYERPQRGREREFWQLNADIFGVDNVLADAEILTMAGEIMKAFGAKDDMYSIKVNNRKLINFMMSDYLELDAVQSQLMIKLFDRKDKMGNVEFRDATVEIFGEKDAPEGLRKLSLLLTATSIAELPKEIRDNEALQEVSQLFVLLETAGIKNAVFDISLMRGFDYYTGMVFEVFDKHPENNRAMFGGGRYDGLVGLFGADPLSAVGMAPGLSMTELFLRSHNLLPELLPTTEIYIVVLGEEIAAASKIAKTLRSEGVNAELDITDRKLDKQLKSAVKKQIPFILFVGSQEVADEIYTLKNIGTSEEQKLGLERIISLVKDRRRKTTPDDEDLFV